MMANFGLLRNLNKRYRELPLRRRVLLSLALPLAVGFGLLMLLGRSQTFSTQYRLVVSQQRETAQGITNRMTVGAQTLPNTALGVRDSASFAALLELHSQLSSPDVSPEVQEEAGRNQAAALNNLGGELFELMRRSSYLTTIRVFDETGQELMRVERVLDVLQITPATELTTISAEPFFQEAAGLEGAAMYISPVEFDPASRQPVIHLTTASLRRETATLGLSMDVQASALLDFVSGAAARASLTPGQAFVLLDSTGLYLADTRETDSVANPDYAGHLFGLNGPDNILAAREGDLLPAFRAEVSAVELGPYYVTSDSFSPFPTAAAHTPWRLLVLEEQAAALADAGSFGVVFALTWLSVFTILVAILWLISGALARPLNEAATIADRVAAGDLSARIPIRYEDELGRLARAVNSMTTRLLANIATLEEQFTERTRDLEVAAEIANKAVGISDASALLNRVISLIRERFGFYHVQVFLVNEAKHQAELVASTGSAGRTLLSLNWALGVGSQSVVGQVTAIGETVIAADTEATGTVHRPNPYLPDTRSEMALPLKSGGTVIGALDIQSIYRDAFSPADVQIFEVLANQLSIALDNVRLLEESHRQVQRVEELNRRLTRQAWDEFLRTQGTELKDFYGTAGGLTDQDHLTPTTGNLTAPIQVRGEVIGLLNAARPGGEAFGDDEIAIVRAVAERVSLAVENARLVVETQISLAETERLYEASQAITSGASERVMLRALADNFGLPNRSIDLFVFGSERDADGRPRRVRRLTAGAPGMRSGEIAEDTLDDAFANRRFYRAMQNLCILPTPEAIADLYPPEMVEQHRLNALANFPVKAGDLWLGRLAVTHYAPYTFSDREREIFEALAGQIATVLRTNQLFSEVETERQTLESVLETMPTAVLVIDAVTKRVTLANEQAADLLGQQVDLIQLAREGRLVRADSTEIFPLEELPAMQALATGEASFNEDLAILRADGLPIDVLNNAAPIRDSAGNVTAVVTVFQNITELRELQSALQDTLRETTAMYESSKTIFAGQDLTDIAQTVLGQVLLNVAPDMAHILLAAVGDSPTEMLTVIAAYPETLPHESLYPTRLFHLTDTILIESEDSDRLNDADRALLARHGIAALGTAPLSVAGETIGWLAFGFTEPHTIPLDQQRFLEALSDQAAVSIQNARLKEQTEEALSQTLLLYNASREITRASTVQQILDTFVSFTLPPEATQAAVLLLEGMPEERHLRVAAFWPHEEAAIRKSLQTLADALGSLLTPDILQQDQPIILEDAPEKLQASAAVNGRLPEDALPVTIALMPMVVGERTLGVVQINYPTPYRHAEGILRTYQSLVDQVASAVENRRLLEQTQSSLAETERLYHASQAIRDAGSTEEALVVLQSLLLAHDPAQIHVYWRQDADLTRIHYWGNQDEIAGPLEAPVGQVIDTTPALIEERLNLPPLYIDSADADVTDAEALGFFAQAGVRSVASIPLQLRTRSVGRLVMVFPVEKGFPKTDRDYLTAICDQTAIVLDNWQLLRRTQESLEETRVLYETSGAIADVNDAPGILQAIVAHATPTAVTSAQLFLLHGESWASPSATLEIGANWSREGGLDLSGMHFTAGQHPAWPELATDTLLTIDNVAADPRLSEESRLVYSTLNMGALAVVPLESAGVPIGALLLGSDQPRVHSEREGRIYQSLAELATISLENIKLLQQTQARARQLQTSAEVSRAVTSILDPSELLPRVVDLIRDNFNYDHVQVFLLDEATHYALLKASTGAVGQTLLNLGWKLEVGSESVIGQVTARAEPVIAGDTADARFIHRPNPHLPDTRSEIAVPLISRGRTVGALDVQANRPMAFSDEDQLILTSLADQIAVALDNARLFEETQNYTLVLSEQVQGLQSLLEASQSFTTMLNADEILSATARYMVDLLRVDHCAIIMAEDDGYTGRIHTEHPARGLTGQTLNLENIWWVEPYRQTHLPVVVPDIAESDLINDEGRAVLQAQNVRATAIIPFLITGDEIEGVIRLDTLGSTRAFTAEEFTLLQLLATQVATAYQNAQLFEGQQAAGRALEEQVRRLESLYATSLALTESLDTSEILSTALGGLVRTLDVDFGTVLLADPTDASTAEVTAWYGAQQPSIMRVPFAINPYYDTLQASNMPIIVEDVKTSPHFVDERRAELVSEGVETMIIAPLTVQSRLIGAFSLQLRRKREITPSEITLVQTITTQVSLAYDNAQLFAQAQRQAEEMGFLFNVTTAAAASADMERSMSSAVELIGSSIPNDVVAVYLTDPDAVFLERVAAHSTAPDITVPERLPLATPALQPVIRDRRPLIIGDLQRTEQDSNLIYGIRSIVAAPLLSGQELVGVLAIFESQPNVYDSGHQRLLQTLSSSLSAVIQNIRLLEEVSAANERLRELDKIKSQFLANMSHELRTPLNSIIGFSRVILKGIDGPLTDMQQQDLETIHTSGQYLLNLINDILDQAKIEADKMALNFAWFDMTTVMEVARSMSVGLLKDKPVRLNMESETDLPKVWGDEIRTRQVLINLLSNASKFTHEGSITINAFTIQRDDGPYVQISVSDTGIGIPTDKIEAVFKAFEQVDGSLTRTTGGTGLGLPISRSLIEMMGGELWAESTLNVGSTFSFVLPAFTKQVKGVSDEEAAAKAEVPSEPKAPVEEQAAPPRKIVMVIDDEVGMHQLYRRYLNKAGYTVEATSNALEAEHLVSLIKPDIIILDVRMPQRDGWDVLKNLKDNDATFAIPVIVCSIDPDTERGFHLGAADYLVKPFLEDDLLTAIRRVEAERQRERILIIDDKPETVRLITQWLQSDNRYETLTATSGQQGLAMIAASLPDLVLLDLNMPDLDGFAVLDKIRQDPATAKLPVVIITAEDDLEAQARERLKETDIYSKNALDEDRLLQGIQAILALYNGDKSE